MSSTLTHDPEALCASLGHELRNPLAAVAMNLAVVEAMTSEADPRREYVDRIGSELGRIQKLLDGLLSIGRGRGLTPAPVAVDVALREVVDRRASMECSADVTLQCEHGLEVLFEQSLFGRVVENLIDNAESAGADQVTVRASARAAGTELRVIDNGPGVPEELEGQIFEPFVGLGSGLGLGLAILTTVLGAVGATLELQRRSDGARGTEAVICFGETA